MFAKQQEDVKVGYEEFKHMFNMNTQIDRRTVERSERHLVRSVDKYQNGSAYRQEINT